MTSGRLRYAAPIARFLPSWALRWVERRRRRHRAEASPVAAEAVAALEPFFPAATLAVARVAVVPRLFGGRLLRLAERVGIPLVEVDRILGITYLDTIVVPRSVADPVPLPTLFHELVHVEQARQLGPRAFVERYVRGWLEAGSYRDIPLERDAYDLERRFRKGPDEPFDVAAEVARRLDPREPFRIRRATLADRPALADLIAASARKLSRGHYDDRQVESALGTATFGVDSELIADGTYFVAEAGGRIVGCGGWSRRKTLFGGDAFQGREAELLDPARDPAKIRAFFVHPDRARRGIGRAILERCEAEARAAGFGSLEMMATLPGIAFYRAAGYAAEEDVALEMEDGVRIDFVRMSKRL